MSLLLFATLLVLVAPALSQRSVIPASLLIFFSNLQMTVSLPALSEASQTRELELVNLAMISALFAQIRLFTLVRVARLAMLSRLHRSALLFLVPLAFM